MCAVLAAAGPWWEPGTRLGYHALTFGFLLGETLRRVTGRTVSELLHEVLTGPLGIGGEVCFAVPRPMLARVARQVAGPAPPDPPEPGSPLDRATPPALRDAAGFGHRADVLTAEIPSRRGSTFGMVRANGSAAYADIDSGLAVAIMRNGPATGGLAAAARIDRLIAQQEEHP